MKLENFRLVKFNNQQIIEIDYLGEIFDLHNAAEFLRIDYAVKAAMLTLFWKYYFDEKHIILFNLKFEEVEYFQIFPRDNEMPNDEDDCLEEINYGNNFEFKFMSGMKIVVKSKKVYFERVD